VREQTAVGDVRRVGDFLPVVDDSTEMRKKTMERLEKCNPHLQSKFLLVEFD
jgi:hypothetical protein